MTRTSHARGSAATNGQTIGTSQMYVDEAGRDNGIASVKENAPGATLVDETA